MRALHARPHKLEVYRFAAVGAAGFATDAGVLTLMLGEGHSVLLSRACSFTCASLLTWWLHRVFTFTHRQSQLQTKTTQYIRYIAVQVAGAVTNLTIFSILVAGEPRLLAWPIIPWRLEPWQA